MECETVAFQVQETLQRAKEELTELRRKLDTLLEQLFARKFREERRTVFTNKNCYLPNDNFTDI